jgi:hypothetical protein
LRRARIGAGVAEGVAMRCLATLVLVPLPVMGGGGGEQFP